MTTAEFELQKAIHTALASHAPLQGLLGGARIYDHVPRSAAFPYVTIGQSTVRDWSTGGDEGLEHLVTLHVWSRAAGLREAKEILAVLRTALHDQALTLSGHRIANLRQEFSDVRRESDGETVHGIVRLRAVTEPV